MADIPPAPTSGPITDKSGMLTPEWRRWIEQLVTIIKGL